MIDWYVALTLIAILSAVSALMAVMVKVLTDKEPWSASAWLVVYLGSALVVGLMWIVARRTFLPGSLLP